MTAPFLLALLAASAAPVPIAPVVDAYPSLSPDGRTLLFQSNRTGRDALWLANADGGNLRVLLDSGDDPAVGVWSPDGKHIAFAANVGEMPEIFVVDRDGKNRRRLTDHPGDDSHPSWSADGKRVFFNSARATPDLSAEWPKQWHNVFSVALDGTDLVQHTRCETVCTYGSPSPDGKRIAFRKVIDAPGFDWGLNSIARNSEVFVADLDGRNERNLSKHAAYDGWPAWSPDGRYVVVSSNRTGRPNAGQLFAIEVDGERVVALTDDAGAAFVQHRFAGPGVVYANRSVEGAGGESGQIVRIDVALPPP